MCTLTHINMEKIKLHVLGISYSQTQSGAYALVLNEEGGERRIPIIVGGFEAQAIAIQLEGLHPPRPLTHDLFFNFASAFHITLKEVLIYKLEEGVFFSRLVCNNGTVDEVVDSRTSDAIALALRFNCPIYTSRDILERAGVVVDFEKEEEEKKAKDEQDFNSEEKTSSTYEEMEEEELKSTLKKAVSEEDYETAAEIQKELKSRGGNVDMNDTL